MSADLAFQAAIYSAIKDEVGGARVEVHPPQNNALPWVQLGESVTEEHPLGSLLIATLHVWSDAEGAHECKQIQEQIRVALQSFTFTQDGYTLACVNQTDARVLFDPNDEVWHGVQEFRAFASS